jgi:hypothetical protein
MRRAHDCTLEYGVCSRLAHEKPSDIDSIKVGWADSISSALLCFFLFSSKLFPSQRNPERKNRFSPESSGSPPSLGSAMFEWIKLSMPNVPRPTYKHHHLVLLNKLCQAHSNGPLDRVRWLSRKAIASGVHLER